MTFQKVHGTQEEKPLSYEMCGAVVFIRKNITRVTEMVGDDEIEMWEYDEAKVPTAEFVENFASEVSDTQETQQSQIDYIAMMSDIDLEEG